MLDLGLSKMAIIGVVALVVIGPEKLPKVARMAGTLYGRAQRYLNDIKSEVSREIQLDELRNLRKDVEESAASFKSEVESQVSGGVDQVQSAWRDASDSNDSSDSSDSSGRHTSSMGFAPTRVSQDDLERKVKDFRRKKLVRSSAVPSWYKHRHGAKTRVLSGAARVRKFRPGVKSTTSFF